MSPRAVRVLREVALIAAEDTRHSAILLRHFGVQTPTTAYHEHNEREKTPGLLARLQAGDGIALISDAGTPLVSDPGYHLVRAAHRAGVTVSPVPGPCAAIAALSAAGLPTDAFVFHGFLPPKTTARRQFLESCRRERRTQVFYETPHRIVAALRDIADVFGEAREATLARELTKRFETLLHGSLGDLAQSVSADPSQQKGEFVLVVAGAEDVPTKAIDADTKRLMEALLKELPLKRAAAVAADLTGIRKNELYEYFCNR
jgi:16S rRNA (cytidine1402-2'-O)-methyltransferase